MNQKFCVFLSMKKNQLLALSLATLLFACGEAPSENSENDKHENEVDTVETVVEEVPEIDEWTQELINGIDPFVQAVLDDDIDYLVSHTTYPIVRQAPLPGLMNEEDFRANYEMIFDEGLKEDLRGYLEDHDIIDRTGATGNAGILNGQLWFDDSGNLISVNYQSETEKEKQAALDEKVRNTIHPVLREYESNVYIGITEFYLFRIDETEKGLRYAQWFSNFTMADEPDFILYDGVSESMGSGGDWQTTFDNVDTKYILSEIAFCEDPEDCGDFLTVEDEGEITERLPVTRVLDPFEVLP